ncbi:hypothetical protein P7H12_25890 [Paenibacillus larvae]|nr:hypothetical protein [Paenibacillus larvae]MDT2266346.1 hypothetical protein [Paenibacillus larvae]
MNVHLLRALDNYLAMPLVLAEGITTRFRRPRYGFLGDYRRQRHGGFEYRSLPSWLVEPDLTEGIFCLSALIASHYLELNKLPLQELSFQRAYYEGEKICWLSRLRKFGLSLRTYPVTGDTGRGLIG